MAKAPWLLARSMECIHETTRTLYAQRRHGRKRTFTAWVDYCPECHNATPRPGVPQ